MNDEDRKGVPPSYIQSPAEFEKLYREKEQLIELIEAQRNDFHKRETYFLTCMDAQRVRFQRKEQECLALKQALERTTSGRSYEPSTTRGTPPSNNWLSWGSLIFWVALVAALWLWSSKVCKGDFLSYKNSLWYSSRRPVGIHTLRIPETGRK